MALYCSKCKSTDKVGVLSIGFGLKHEHYTTSNGGNRYLCEKCADAIINEVLGAK